MTDDIKKKLLDDQISIQVIFSTVRFFFLYCICIERLIFVSINFFEKLEYLLYRCICALVHRERRRAASNVTAVIGVARDRVGSSELWELVYLKMRN